MSMDQAAIWLSASVLAMLGFVAIIIGLVVVNNILHKFWKPVKLLTTDSFTIFGGYQAHITQDPLNFLSKDEYEILIKHLEEMRANKKEEKKERSS